MNNQQPDKFNVNSQVEKHRNILLKTRLKTLVYKKGMKESDFYKSLGLSKDYWYQVSWGKVDCPLALKIRIAEALDTDSALIWQDKDTIKYATKKFLEDFDANIFSGKKEGVESGSQ